MECRTPQTPLALRPREAARMLQVSPRTLWTWTRQGLLPCIKIGRAVLYPTDSLRRWLAEQAGGQAAPSESAASIQ
ncbi:MAG TPA: helix-turn-helix domain-containing protein [Thermoguttaceae bacterium]|nr:helix-turn-helix domain-containing protein [Thermoguttaceae bacterium]